MADGARGNVEWKTLFRDDFERKEMGDRWQFVSGTWEIKGGTAVSPLQPSSVGFSAFLVCKQIVPRDHEFSFDVSVDKPMLIQTILSDQMHENSIGSIFIGIPTNAFNFGEKGGLIYRVVNKAYSQESSRRDPSFEFVPGRVYRVSMRREGSLISMLLDGKLYRSAEVSIDTPLPYLNLQAMFGPINSTLTIDNAELRVPSDSDLERRAMELVQQLFNERELRPLVLSALQDRDWQEEKDSASLEEEMRRLIDLWPQNEKSLLKRIQELTLSRKFKSGEELTSVDFQFLYDWLDKEVRSKTDDVWRTAAECASLAGNQAASDAARIESQKMHEWRRGCIHPVDAALAAISYTRQAKHAEAEEKMELLNQLVLAPHWKDDPHVSYWKRIATQLVSEAAIEKPVHPNDSDIQSATELKQLTWDMQAALLLDGNSEFLAELLTDDAVRIDRRTADDTNPLIAQREPWLETERLHSLPGPITGNRLTRVKVDVTKNLDNPIVTSQFVFELPSGHFRWLQIDEFSQQRDDVPYRLSKQTIQTLYMFYRGIEFNIERDGWTRADADVEAAQAKQDKELELGTLLLASRKQEAFEVVKTLVKEKQDARSFILVADAARETHRGDVMRKAMKKAIDLDPLVMGPPYVRAFAAQQLFGEKPEKLRDDLTIRVPSFYKIASKELIGTGESGLAAWHPTIESLVGVLTIPKDNDPNENQGFEKNIQKLIESRESTYGATTLRQRTMTFAGHTAIEFVQRGTGIGRALAGFGQGNPTIQRFVVIDSPSSCLMLFVSAFESEFVLRDSEFEQVWRTLEFR